jgi:putative tricarboxylic transport membrane protein
VMPFHKSGKDFTKFVNNQILDIQILSKDIGLIK